MSGMLLPRFDYEAPPTLADALARLDEAKDEARILAGGTDLLVKMKRRAARPRLVISLRRVTGLDDVTTTGTGGVRIGALMTMSDVAGSCALSGRWAGLVEGAASVGGPIIRNRATIGGNIVSARPCADTVPALVALGARLHLEGRRSRRAVDIDGFITGPGRTGIGCGEVLTAIELPAPGTAYHGSCYLKLTRRAAMEVTIVGCAACLDLEDDARTIRAARLVFASVAPIPLRVQAAEQALEGRIADAAVLRDAAALARHAARPIDDCRAPADFRTEMVEILARRALSIALSRARGGVAS
jgi:carbon-monoxide dehydrogenase medium subunit